MHRAALIVAAIGIPAGLALIWLLQSGAKAGKGAPRAEAGGETAQTSEPYPDAPTVVAAEAGPVAGAPAPFPAVRATDWPLFRGNPLQSGTAAAALPDKLHVLWKFKTKGAVEGAAAMVGDVVFIGSADENLYALDRKTGQEKWRYRAAPFRAPPAVHEGCVYVGDSDGKFHCLDAATGKPRWTFDTASAIVGGANFVDDSVLVGSGSEFLHCLSLDGKERWKFRIPGGPVFASPAVVAGRTFVGGCDSIMHEIETAKGKEIVKVPLDGQTGASAAVDGDQLYVGTRNQFLAVDWKKGKVAWRFEPAPRPEPFFASAAVAGDLVIAGCRDKRVYALNRKTGAEVWRFQTKGKVDSSPVIAGSRVYAGSFDGSLYVLDLATGREIERFALGRPGRGIAASIAVADGCLVVGTLEGIVFCLGDKK